MTKKVYRFAQTLVLPMAICPALSIADEDSADNGVAATVTKTAAEIDWRPVDQMTDKQREGVPSYCEGGYVVPPYLSEDASNASATPSEVPINASAQSATYDADQNIHLQVSANYSELHAFNPWLNTNVIPAIHDKLLSERCGYS